MQNNVFYSFTLKHQVPRVLVTTLAKMVPLVGTQEPDNTSASALPVILELTAHVSMIISSKGEREAV